MLRLLTLSALILSSSLALAAPQIRVVGLFPGAAVLSIDGQRKLLKVGQSAAGVQLLRADARKAVLRVDGVDRDYSLERDYSEDGAVVAEDAPPVQVTPEGYKELNLARGASGQYWIMGNINGQSVQFQVDTKASSVLMNEAQARQLGINYTQGTPASISTAAGTNPGWKITLNSLRMGGCCPGEPGIEVFAVPAMVLQGGYPTDIQLGKSYFDKVNWREEQGMLYVRAK